MDDATGGTTGTPTKDGKRLAKASPNVDSGERETSGAQASDYGAPIPLDIRAMDDAAGDQEMMTKGRTQTNKNVRRRERKAKIKA